MAVRRRLNGYLCPATSPVRRTAAVPHVRSISSIGAVYAAKPSRMGKKAVRQNGNSTALMGEVGQRKVRRVTSR